MEQKYSYALSFVANDAKGLISEASRVLYDNGFNIADSSSILLQGVFSMIFIVQSDKNYTEKAVKNMFADTRVRPNVFKCSDEINDTEYNHYSISVYGADKPGIVHQITSFLAEKGINITELQTKTAGRYSSKVYIMILEAAVPADLVENEWTERLYERAKNIGTDVTCKKLETYEF